MGQKPVVEGALEMNDVDAWSRFERAVDAAVKSGPKHRASDKPSKKSQGLPDGVRLLPKENWVFKRYPGGIIAAGIFDSLRYPNSVLGKIRGLRPSE